MNPIEAIKLLKDSREHRSAINGEKVVIVPLRALETILLEIETLYPDNCSICKGQKGGVKGNENIIDGKIMCDYCSVKESE